MENIGNKYNALPFNTRLLVALGVGAFAVVSFIAYKNYKKNNPSNKTGTFGVDGDGKSNATGRRTGASTTTLSRENKILRDGTPVTVIGLPPNPTNLWISSGDPEKCTWYDKDGNATVTYNKPCTLAQANMKGGGSPK